MGQAEGEGGIKAGATLPASRLISLLFSSFIHTKCSTFLAVRPCKCTLLYTSDLCPPAHLRVSVRAEIVCESRWRGGVCRVTAVLSAFMWTCWICSWLTYQSALFSSLREALNIHRLCLSVAATDSSELPVCARGSVGLCVCLHLTGVFMCPPVRRSFSASVCAAPIWCLGRSIERWSGVRVIADLVGQSMTQTDERWEKKTRLWDTTAHTHTPCWEKSTPAGSRTHLSICSLPSVTL